MLTVDVVRTKNYVNCNLSPVTRLLFCQMLRRLELTMPADNDGLAEELIGRNGSPPDGGQSGN